MNTPTDDEIGAAQDAGENAARQGAHVSSCPYRTIDEMAATEQEHVRYLQRVWTHRYRRAQAEMRAARAQVGGEVD